MSDNNKDCHHNKNDLPENNPNGKPLWFKIGLIGMILILGYFLITEHQAHVIQYLPLILLLSCPLMHFFMHSGHGHGGGGPGHDGKHQHKDEDKENKK